MKKKLLVAVNILVLIFVVLVISIIVFRVSFTEEEAEVEECIDVNNVASFIYDSCYDAYTKQIFISLKRSYDSYQLRGIKFSFFDFSDKSYEITDIPNTNGSKAYKISAEKNPQELNVYLNVVKDFSALICSEPRRLFVKYCPLGIQQEGVNVTISPFTGVDASDYVSVGPGKRDSDILSMNLVDKERIWKSQCISVWNCGGWEDCEEGIQRRECIDSRDCFIPTDVLETTKYCDGTCVESWGCEWSDCRSGKTVPECEDFNKCGTKFSLPQPLACDADGECLPEIQCSEWSQCSVDYNFDDLLAGKIRELEGVKSRICADKNSCIDTIKETRKCSVSVDIYTRRFSKCGSDFVGVYNRLNNELIARIEEGSLEQPFLNIHLDDIEEKEYCDYCFDGVMNGDEGGVDCGGSCEACADRYRRTDYQKPGFWKTAGDWVKRALT